MDFLSSEAIGELIAPHEGEFLDGYDHLYDSTCTNGYDNDGSTGFEIFASGVALGILAGEKPIYYHNFEEENVTVFFVGTEEEILARLKDGLEEQD